MRPIFVLETGRSVNYQRKVFFSIPQVGDKGFYRTIGSFTAFFHSRRNRKNITERRQFTEHEISHVSMYNNTTEHDVTLHDFDEFLLFIGFDNKTKKYISGERILKWDNNTNKWK